MSVTTILFGRPLANDEAQDRKIGVLEGVPAMGLDGLGSASYGPEAALAVLAVAGAGGLGELGPIMWAILLLLAVLFFSYWQTITAYPTNGGAYTVARANLGAGASLLAASALMLDYMLNVAVGISAGVGALVSAVPSLHAWTLPLCLAILALLTLVNMRGTRESGLVFALPTYLFIASLGGVLAIGVVKAFAAGGHPQPVIAPPALAGAGAVGLWLLLRAFASGCTAMTGVEAVSNGVNAFREPRVRYAHSTLTVIVVVLGVLLAGIAYVARAYGVMAMDQTQDGYQSVVSLMVGAVWGHGWLYVLTIGSVLAVLCLSANTSFVGFPRLCRLVAEDGFMPRSFAVPGRRLVYSVGIFFLAGGAGLLLAAFGGITDRLIPLFAIGAFLSFTLSQAGMAVHWWREGRGAVDHARLAVNGIGAVATGAALAIILAAKFIEGAWLTVIVIPAFVLLLRAIRRYYDRFDAELLPTSARRLRLQHHEPPVVLVPIEQWDRMTAKALHFAYRISRDVVALYVSVFEGEEAEKHEAELRRDWHGFAEAPAERAGLPPPPLMMVQSRFRSDLAPLLRTIEQLEQGHPNRCITVVISELIEGRWWETLLHTHRTRRLRARLLRYAGPHVGVLVVPWQLGEAHTEQAIAEEEPKVAA